MDKERDTPAGIDRNPTQYGDPGFSRYLRRAFLASSGFDRDDLERPIIGIADTSSDYTTCHRDMPALVEAVKRGVLEAGGLPLVFPTISLAEILLSPTAMLYRNLLAMSTEEMIRAQPMDGVVLVGGCDKTVPAQLMAAVSADLPALLVVAGPMRTGSWQGERLGACTDCRRYWLRHRGGALSEDEIHEVEQALCPTGGTCMVMGTASTMACMAATLGMMLPGGATPPSGSGDRLRQGVATGRQAVTAARNRIVPSGILTRHSFLNALTVLAALSGSTNAIVHLLAVARRARIDLSLEDFHAVSAEIPVLVDCKPAGQGYMEDFDRAGGLPALLKTLETKLHVDEKTVSGRTIRQILEDVAPPGAWQDTIRTPDRPVKPSGALCVLYGSLAPDGAVIKRGAASPALLRHRGPAVVFESPDDVAARIDDPALVITPDSVLVLRNAGPVGAGMPEAGSLPIPRRLAAQGVTDMVRVSDARMSGTAYGTVVLHGSPEAAVGGPLALVRDGDIVELDVEARRIDLCVETDELERRRASFRPPPPPERGWRWLYTQHVLPAHQGADLDFLV
ncbi:MAG: dihydroxy-acid dehydratase [candidate division Zixibacteria bacterium]|nr:dihydroxy-acid dehydratase [candidate division Zixibacteria bacterium]